MNKYQINGILFLIMGTIFSFGMDLSIHASDPKQEQVVFSWLVLAGLGVDLLGLVLFIYGVFKKPSADNIKKEPVK